MSWSVSGKKRLKFGQSHTSSICGKETMPLPEDLNDDFYDDETEETVVCPECGSDDLGSLGEDDDGNAVYECVDCGERFTEEEEGEE
jgi:DNA-directed RNA polymerase subunit RPC12/RpoP